MPFVPQKQEKCKACQRTVYVTEALRLEGKDQEDTAVYHKQCVRCKTCNKPLDLGTLVQEGSDFWCKTHFLSEFKEKGTIGNKKFGVTNTPTTPRTFVPVDENSTGGSPSEKKETSSETAEKIRKWRTDADPNKCIVCEKTVYLNEKLVVERKGQSFVYHKPCFKCQFENEEEGRCVMLLDVRTYGTGTVDGKIYCDKHLKVVNANDHRKRTGTTGFQPVSSTFVPADTVESYQKPSKSETPAHVAAKFKGLGGSEKCESCGKAVYSTERATIEKLNEESHIFHKTCLKCSHCNCFLDLSNYGTSDGKLFCTVHLKQFGKAQKVKDGYFVSPLKTEFSNTRSDNQDPANAADNDNDNDNDNHRTGANNTDNNDNNDDSPARTQPDDDAPVADDRQEDIPDTRAADNSTDGADAAAAANSSSTSAAAGGAEDDEAEREERRRQRDEERERRRKDREAEEAAEEAERLRRQEERKKRLAELEQ